MGCIVGGFVPVNRDRDHQVGFGDIFLILRIRRCSQRIEVIHENGLDLSLGNPVGHMLGDAAAGFNGRIFVGDAGTVNAGPFFRLQPFGRLETAEGRTGRRHQSALLIEIAEQSVDDNIGLGNLGAANIVVVQSVIAGIQKGRRGILGQIAGDFPDFGRRNVANRCRFFGSEVFVGIPKFVEAEDIFLNESFIVKIFADQCVGDSQKQRQIRSRPDRDPFIGDFGQFTEPGIDYDDLSSLFLGRRQLLHGGGNDGAAVIAAGEQHVFCPANINGQLIGGHFVPGVGFGGETG